VSPSGSGAWGRHDLAAARCCSDSTAHVEDAVPERARPAAVA
jgi:hypothetical protein